MAWAALFCSMLLLLGAGSFAAGGVGCCGAHWVISEAVLWMLGIHAQTSSWPFDAKTHQVPSLLVSANPCTDPSAAASAGGNTRHRGAQKGSWPGARLFKGNGHKGEQHLPSLTLDSKTLGSGDAAATGAAVSDVMAHEMYA
jgi:hypothetical protein